MSAVYISERIEQLDDLYNKIDITESEELLLDRESYQKFKDSLLSILEIRKQPIYEKSKYLSNKMDPNKLSADQFTEFYHSCVIFKDTFTILTAKMKQIISNNIPVLELFPGKGQFTSECVAAEPLYIADYYSKNLNNVGNIFNNFYNQRRLIKLEIKDFDIPLPNNQIGLVTSFCYFMVKDKDFVANWAREVFRILCPGGTFIFNFISGNSSHGIYIAERNSLTIINPDELSEELLKIGYIIDKIDIQSGYGSTFTIRKPGDLDRIKMSSSLARIIDKSVPLV
jgi:SAM-dependent methyltransferase